MLNAEGKRVLIGVISMYIDKKNSYTGCEGLSVFSSVQYHYNWITDEVDRIQNSHDENIVDIGRNIVKENQVHNVNLVESAKVIRE